MAQTPGSEFIGQLLEAQVRSTQNATNVLIDTHLDAAIEWAEAFARLFDRIEAVNDSLKIDRILVNLSWRRDDVERSVEHYRAMKMGEIE